MPKKITSNSNLLQIQASSDPKNIVAVGGDLSINTLRISYRNGVFPWYSEDSPILWWCPDPRFVLYLDEFCITRSIKRALNASVNQKYSFKVNISFTEVIHNCAYVNRNFQDGTWIVPKVLKAYSSWHEKYPNEVLSFELWENTYSCDTGKTEEKIVGGMYGVLLGKIFFGESMFSLVDNASKIVLFHSISYLKENFKTQIIDCQQHSGHMERIGARFISKKNFLKLCSELIG